MGDVHFEWTDRAGDQPFIISKHDGSAILPGDQNFMNYAFNRITVQRVEEGKLIEIGSVFIPDPRTGLLPLTQYDRSKDELRAEPNNNYVFKGIDGIANQLLQVLYP